MIKNFDSIFTKLKKLILRSEKIIITTHINPDGDAIGSLMAMYEICKNMGKLPRLINYSPTPKNLMFLDKEKIIEVYNPQLHDNLIAKCDSIFILDLNSPKRLNSLGKVILQSTAHKVVIDHHLNPVYFADFYYCDFMASSTGQMISRFAFHNDILTKEVSIPLYVAIMTDSGNFQFDRTTSELFDIASRLVSCGIEPHVLYDQVYNRRSMNAVQLLGRAYNSIEFYANGKFGIMSIFDKDIVECQAEEDDTEGFVNINLSIENVVAGALLIESKMSNQIRMSLRSKNDVSIREIAASFGGGGHKYASGARIEQKSLEEVKKELIIKMENHLK